MRTLIVLGFLAGACAGTAATVAIDPSRAGLPAFVKPYAAAEVRRSPNGKALVHLLAQGDNAFLGKLEMAAGAEVPEHRDATEEYIHVLEGRGRVFIDDVESAVEPGSTIYMPPNAKVRFQNGDARMVGIQVWAGPAPAKKYEAWTPLTAESAPVPFTAEELRSAYPTGAFFRYRNLDDQKVTRVVTTTFVESTAQGAKIETKVEDVEGRVLDAPRQVETTWEELHQHGAFPKDATEIQDVEITTALGREACWYYVVRQPDKNGRPTELRMWFAKALPGPPVQFETLRDGQLILSGTMIERKSGADHRKGE